MGRLTFLMCLVAASGVRAEQAPQQVVQLGACALASGEYIKGCQVGYRWYGTPNRDLSNIIVVPTWFMGTSAMMGMLLGPDRLFDLPNHALLVIDAFGDGVSSSPSNSIRQPGEQFPPFTIADTVRWQYALIHDVLGIAHVKAVIGLSMGGMQALQWAVDYPDFMDKIVSIVATPKVTAEDIVGFLLLLPHGDLPHPWTGITDRRYQLRSMATHDIGAGAPLSDVAQRIHARTLMVLASRDRLLRPEPSLELAGSLDCEVIVLNGPCGHFAGPLCEMSVSRLAMRKFLLDES